MKQEIATYVRASLERSTDDLMEGFGFTRRRNSLIYERITQEAKQSLDIFLEIHPTDNRDASAAVYPRVKVVMPCVEKAALDMVGGDRKLLGNSDAVVSSPINFLCPKSVASRWFIYQSDSVATVLDGLYAHLQEWIVPFFDDYGSLESMCTAYMNVIYQDDPDPVLPVRSLKQILRIIAALSLVGRGKDAVFVAEKFFGKPGPRRDYSVMFEYLARKTE